MKLSRLLLMAGAGIAIGYWLTRTEKGNRVRKDIADRAGDWAGKLRDLREQSTHYAEDLLQDAKKVAGKVRSKADGQFT